MQAKGTMRNTGSPSGDCSTDQRTARERQAGPSGMAERLVVLMKPGNSGGGKGPQLKADARSDDGREIGDEPDNSQWLSRVAGGVTCNGPGDCMSLLREPDAVNLPVRFEEAGCGNGSMAELVGHRQTKGSETDRLGLNHRATPRLHMQPGCTLASIPN